MFLFLPRRSNFAIFDGKVTKKRAKSQIYLSFSECKYFDEVKWWFSATDIVRAINDEDDYKKCRNYWKYLKGKMAKDGIELVSVTNHFKFQSPKNYTKRTVPFVYAKYSEICW